MLKQTTAWDQALLRKFSNTGHFRLLNQLRTELKLQPLIRDPNTRKLTLQAMPIRSVSYRANRRPYTPEASHSDKTQAVEAKENQSSFRQRLNAIEMR
ncbi:hypothetical protein PMIT1342_01683 [Prochlorococcus marinus str. MIT 1342]|uniref:hypothetical protein n=1 Tax=Prochlorococcus TaxID=1218 RepID=UPI0007B35EBE|nr:hypothetical protein [Prochlorococcus marinus]KZR81347.1 hypothetical protein PMIT1342_01683 [Prochlorococcus marinus str. MIT 1342]